MNFIAVFKRVYATVAQRDRLSVIIKTWVRYFCRLSLSSHAKSRSRNDV